MSLILIFKLVVVLLFLIQFLRRPSLPWGVGLLTVTSALLLDTIFGTFDADYLRAELGFFFYVIIGFLLGGAAYWLLGLLWPTIKKERQPAEATAVHIATPAAASAEPQPAFGQVTAENGVLYDLQLMYQDLNTKFDIEECLDLIFDLNIPDQVISNVNGSQSLMAADIVRYAEQTNQAAQLALAIERILNPPAAETLPRLAKITPNSPRPILRYYLLANLELNELQETAVALNLNWDQLDGQNKYSKTRQLLSAVYRKDRVQSLLTYLQANQTAAETSDES